MSDVLTEKIIGAAIEVHRVLGTGYLDSVYKEALCHELKMRGIQVGRQVDVDVFYRDQVIKGQWIDILVEGEVIVAVKAIDCLPELAKVQTSSLLKATRLKGALLLNFEEKRLVDGTTRISL